MPQHRGSEQATSPNKARNLRTSCKLETPSVSNYQLATVVEKLHVGVPRESLIVEWWVEPDHVVNLPNRQAVARRIDWRDLAALVEGGSLINAIVAIVVNPGLF